MLKHQYLHINPSLLLPILSLSCSLSHTHHIYDSALTQVVVVEGGFGIGIDVNVYVL